LQSSLLTFDPPGPASRITRRVEYA